MTKATQRKLERASRDAVRELAKQLRFPVDATNAQVIAVTRAMQDELEIGIKILTALDTAQQEPA